MTTAMWILAAAPLAALVAVWAYGLRSDRRDRIECQVDRASRPLPERTVR